jgi:Flp pilus assembly pilin Flp
MAGMLAAIGRLVAHEDGQDLLEYGLLAVLIAIAAMAAVTMLGQQVNAVLWQTIVNNF